jgi:tyrosinase
MSTDVTLDVTGLREQTDFTRADLFLYGLDHSGPSYSIRVFLNAPDADRDTALTDEAGYAGSVTVFGHGGCFGEEGHCDPRGPVTVFDRRLPHQLEPATRVLICTDAVRRALGQRDQLQVRLVPLVRSSPFVTTEQREAPDDLLTVAEVALRAYR